MVWVPHRVRESGPQVLSYSVGYSTERGHVTVTGDMASALYRSVGVTGFEPATSSSRTKRATKLRHTPLQGALERTSVSLADNLGGSRMLTTIGASA
jgi:hypothetical protein